MTVQYETEDINGQPSPLSLSLVVPVAPPVAGGVDTEAIFWPSAAADAVVTGNGITVAGSAAAGTIFQFTQPGVYEVIWTQGDLVPIGSPLNILRGVTVAVTAGNGYPALDFTVAGVIATKVVSAAIPDTVTLSATFRITNADLVDAGLVVNANRQLRLSAVGAQIGGLAPPSTSLTITRVSL